MRLRGIDIDWLSPKQERRVWEGGILCMGDDIMHPLLHVCSFVSDFGLFRAWSLNRLPSVRSFILVFGFDNIYRIVSLFIHFPTRHD